jgi:hypothetical protein
LLGARLSSPKAVVVTMRIAKIGSTGFVTATASKEKFPAQYPKNSYSAADGR